MKQVVEDLKGRPKDEKQAVAGGIAITIAVLLFVIWGFFFFKKIARGGEVNIPFGGVQRDVVQGASLNQVTDDFLRSYNDASAELRAIRDQAAVDLRTDTSFTNDAAFETNTSVSSGFGL